SPVRMPYEVNRATYATAPIFLWQSPRAEPVHRHPMMREFYRRYEQDFYETETLTVRSLIATKVAFAIAFLVFYFGPALLLPLLMLPRSGGRSRSRRARGGGVLHSPLRRSPDRDQPRADHPGSAAPAGVAIGEP